MIDPCDHTRHATWTSSVRNLFIAQVRISPELFHDDLPLCTSALCQRRAITHPVAKKTSLCDHDTIINAKSE